VSLLTPYFRYFATLQRVLGITVRLAKISTPHADYLVKSNVCGCLTQISINIKYGDTARVDALKLQYKIPYFESIMYGSAAPQKTSFQLSPYDSRLMESVGYKISDANLKFRHF